MPNLVLENRLETPRLRSLIERHEPPHSVLYFGRFGCTVGHVEKIAIHVGAGTDGFVPFWFGSGVVPSLSMIHLNGSLFIDSVV